MAPTITEACLETRNRMAAADWSTVAGYMGRPLAPEGIQVAFFGEPHWIGPQGCRALNGGTASEAVELVLGRYVLRFPAVPPPDGPCVTFRELEGAGPLSQRFADNTHKIITTTFGRSADRLRMAAQAVIACRPEAQSGFDLALRFEALVRVPLYLRFNAADDEFPAQASLLFHRSAALYLDLQTLFIAATYLTGRLIAGTGGAL
ncbi:MAG: DUF3786 domain-containing protein [Desulfatitalea sp.]|nr:DUF3786 domain-containing protein [Desulfatitalea sp.]